MQRERRQVQEAGIREGREVGKGEEGRKRDTKGRQERCEREAYSRRVSGVWTLFAKRNRILGPVPKYRVASLAASKMLAKTCYIQLDSD